jgi:ketosteroid isomerase-like protein
VGLNHENVGIVRRLIEAYNRPGSEAEAALSLFDEAAVFEEPPEQPGARIARGRAEIGRVVGRFDGVWEEHRAEVVEIRAVDADRVLLLSTDHFRGRDGIEVTKDSGTVFTLRDGKVVRMQSFWERENALRAVGEPDSGAGH